MAKYKMSLIYQNEGYTSYCLLSENRKFELFNMCFQSEMVTPETSMNMSLAAFLASLQLESSHLHQIRQFIHPYSIPSNHSFPSIQSFIPFHPSIHSIPSNLSFHSIQSFIPFHPSIHSIPSIHSFPSFKFFIPFHPIIYSIHPFIPFYPTFIPFHPSIHSIPSNLSFYSIHPFIPFHPIIHSIPSNHSFILSSIHPSINSVIH